MKENIYLALPPFPTPQAMDGWLTYLYNPHLLCGVLLDNFFLPLDL